MRQIALVVPMLLLPGLAAAQSDEPSRYRLERTPDGYVRMDTRTGEMSICRENSGELVCKAAVNESPAIQGEVDRLRAEIKTLEERVVKLENSLAARLENSLPTEEDFNKTMGYMERFFRKFMDIVKDFEGGSKPAEPSPDRT